MGDRTLSDDKWVRVMADYSADGLWNKDGAAIDDYELPIPQVLKNRLKVWQSAYETNECFDKMPDYWIAEGEEIAKEIKKLLPDWKVIYFNEARIPEEYKLGDDRTSFEYEV